MRVDFYTPYLLIFPRLAAPHLDPGTPEPRLKLGCDGGRSAALAFVPRGLDGDHLPRRVRRYWCRY